MSVIVAVSVVASVAVVASIFAVVAATFILAVVVSLPMSDSDMKLMTVDQFHMESAFKRARNMGVKYSHEFYSHDPLEKVSCDHYARRVL